MWLLAGGVVAISLLHYAANSHAILIHEVLRRLYYVPIVIAAVGYGAQVGMSVALLASVLYLPHIVISWAGWPVFEVGQYGEIVLFNVVAVVTGVMADRLRQERNRQRELSDELAVAYERLKASTEAQLQAERLSTVGRAASGIAHAIRTPLSGILGCVEILFDDYPAGSPRREFLAMLRRDVARVDDVVARFLEFAQPVSPTFRSADLNELADRAVRLAGARAEGSRISLVRSEVPVPIQVDVDQSERALVDLLLEAASLNPSGAVTVRTEIDQECRRLSIDAALVGNRLSIDPFEPFKDGSDSGLALAMVRRMLENQGGSITARHDASNVAFEIRLPRVPDSNHVTPPASPAAW